MTQPATAQTNDPELNKQGYPVICEPVVQQVITSCQGVITNAELYMNSMGETIDQQDTLIRQQNRELTQRMDQIEQLTQDKRTWYKNPVYVGLTGVLAGFVLNSVIQR